jgi:hypothetical protein
MGVVVVGGVTLGVTADVGFCVGVIVVSLPPVPLLIVTDAGVEPINRFFVPSPGPVRNVFGPIFICMGLVVLSFALNLTDAITPIPWTGLAVFCAPTVMLARPDSIIPGAIILVIIGPLVMDCASSFEPSNVICNSPARIWFSPGSNPILPM